ncbi:unnamed protein product [Linum tenue]|uniref:J domain-containing protein n=1 Tax=Linum tenue TaxID=586396 RepID=A0AAV0M940_9ROSI|nr:unnamed protein product [Linum tenue]
MSLYLFYANPCSLAIYYHFVLADDNFNLKDVHQATPFLAGVAVAAAALAGRCGIQAWQAFKARPPRMKTRRFYDGGFQPKMTRREAALILGESQFSPDAMLFCFDRESATPDKVKEAHRKVMVANHPDADGSDLSRIQDQ